MQRTQQIEETRRITRNMNKGAQILEKQQIKREQYSTYNQSDSPQMEKICCKQEENIEAQSKVCLNTTLIQIDCQTGNIQILRSSEISSEDASRNHFNSKKIEQSLKNISKSLILNLRRNLQNYSGMPIHNSQYQRYTFGDRLIDQKFNGISMQQLQIQEKQKQEIRQLQNILFTQYKQMQALLE